MIHDDIKKMVECFTTEEKGHLATSLLSKVFGNKIGFILLVAEQKSYNDLEATLYSSIKNNNDVVSIMDLVLTNTKKNIENKTILFRGKK